MLVIILLAAPPIHRVEARSKPARKVKKAKKAAKRGASSRRRRRRVDRWPPMKMEHVNRGEKISVRVYDRRGYNSKSSLRKIKRFLRCHRTGKQRTIHWRLIRSLYSISRHYKGRVIKVYSGYRHRRVAKLRTSNHIKGRAIDFRVQGVSKKALRDYLRKRFSKSGVGYYPNSPFVHFDVRSKKAFWVDTSGRGEGSQYVNSWAYVRDEGKKVKIARARTAITPPVKEKEEAPAQAAKPKVEKKEDPVAAKPAPAQKKDPPAQTTQPAAQEKETQVAAESPAPAPKGIPKTVVGPPPLGETPRALSQKIAQPPE